MRYNNCRVCGGSDLAVDRHLSKYNLIQYGVRHWVHADCGLKRDGAKFFTKLTRHQLAQFPYFAAADAGLVDEMHAAVAAAGGMCECQQCQDNGSVE
jgi:hypothetical protein